jgi:hypothetical protein
VNPSISKGFTVATDETLKSAMKIAPCVYFTTDSTRSTFRFVAFLASVISTSNLHAVILVVPFIADKTVCEFVTMFTYTGSAPTLFNPIFIHHSVTIHYKTTTDRAQRHSVVKAHMTNMMSFILNQVFVVVPTEFTYLDIGIVLFIVPETCL